MLNLVSRTIVSTALLVLLLVTAFLGAWVPADAKLWELRFRAADRPPSGEVIFVDIDSASLAEIGIWPWPRSLHARLLDQLMAMGAYEVAFDIDFSTSGSAAEDAAFAASLERAGGYAYLAAFRQLSVSGAEIWNRPLALFGRFAESALVNVDSLEAGMVWSLPGQNATQDLQSIAAYFNPGKAAPEHLHIDYSIDLGQVVRLPAAAVLDGSADPSLILDRQVVIGSSAIELHDLLLVPRFGVMPGPMVHIAAVETVRQDRALTDLGNWPAMGLSVLFVLGSLVLPRMRFGVAVADSVVAAVAFEAATGMLFAACAVQIDTSLFHVLVAGILVIRLLEERAIRRQQLRRYHERLEYLADHDEETGALSQSAWCSKMQETGTPSKALLLRLEQLDGAGASLGFAVTDQVVKLFHERLLAATNLPIGRIESYVFALAVPDAAFKPQLNRLIELTEAPFDAAGHLVVLNLRFGISQSRADAAPAVALQQARTALAMAARRDLAGCAYEPQFDTELHKRRAINIELRTAIENDELDIAFQLQVETTSRKITGAEALLRWTSAEFGRVSPAEFIPLAEDNGTIVRLGSWVLHESCRRAVANAWPGRLSVNVSPAQFALSDVVPMVRSALADSGFPADRLDLEVTESLVAGGEASIIEALVALRSLGVSIAVDDFGTGHSSLSHLATLPVDKLKIDMSFVRQITTPRGAEVAQNIAELGKRLGLSIVVEGVETETEFDFFAALGCDTIQGYLFSRPGPLPQREVDAAA